MPTYVYACDTCGKQFEKFQSFKEAALDTCPCAEQSNAIRRVFQPVGIVFKGSGWYVTDSRSSSDTSSSSSSSASSNKAAASSSGDTDKDAATPSNDKSDKSDKGDKSDTSAPGGSTSPASAE